MTIERDPVVLTGPVGAPDRPRDDRTPPNGVAVFDDLGMDLADRSRPRWARPGLAALLVVTAVAYTWGLDRSGTSNSFYAAAVEAATRSWKALFFGSLDSSNFITVDKPPGSLWVMDLSARLFGFNTWSLLLPEALEGVAAVAVLYATVRRWFGAGAGLLAGAVLAATQVAAVMFRFDNPDALLTLLLVGAAYCVTRAVERAGTRWVVAAGALVGFAFLTKMLQAFTVVPAFGLVYLLAAPTSLRRRLAQLGAGLAAIVVAGGWWVAVVALVPAADRPYIDGSPDNSILNLIFVYNGFGRLTGSGNGASFSGTPGILRLFNDAMGGQASWLIPAALVAAVAGVVARRGRPRTDRVRAGILLWAGWLLVTGAVFSYGRGIIHSYYTVALAPAVAAAVGVGVRQAWLGRRHLTTRIVAAAAVAGTGTWAWALLDRTPSWHPWIRAVVAGATVLAVVAVLALAARRLSRWAAAGLAALVAVACLSGPVAYAADAVFTPETTATPSAGPATAATTGFGGAGFTRRFTGRPEGAIPKGALPEGARPGGGARRFDGTVPAGAGGATTTTSAALVKALKAGASSYRWVAAVEGSQSAASLELATGGEAVMAIGGFSGRGGNLSLAQFEAYVAKGDIHYYTSGGVGGPGAGRSGSAIASWVAAHYKATTIGGETVYDLTSRS